MPKDDATEIRNELRKLNKIMERIARAMEAEDRPAVTPDPAQVPTGEGAEEPAVAAPTGFIR